jgi:hypothetical protein
VHAWWVMQFMYLFPLSLSLSLSLSPSLSLSLCLSISLYPSFPFSFQLCRARKLFAKIHVWLATLPKLKSHDKKEVESKLLLFPLNELSHIPGPNCPCDRDRRQSSALVRLRVEVLEGSGRFFLISSDWYAASAAAARSTLIARTHEVAL